MEINKKTYEILYEIYNLSFLAIITVFFCLAMVKIMELPISEGFKAVSLCILLIGCVIYHGLWSLKNKQTEE